jgi:hypothetical protein
MKVMVRMAILVTTLLLVSNVAFSACTNEQELCYSINATDENGDTFTDTWFVSLCDEGTGSLASVNSGCFELYLFGGGPGWPNPNGNPMFGGHPFYTSWIAYSAIGAAGYIQPMGSGKDLLTGEGISNETKYVIKGKKVPCPMVILVCF